jgi:hypothetical protein
VKQPRELAVRTAYKFKYTVRARELPTNRTSGAEREMFTTFSRRKPSVLTGTTKPKFYNVTLVTLVTLVVDGKKKKKNTDIG